MDQFIPELAEKIRSELIENGSLKSMQSFLDLINLDSEMIAQMENIFQIPSTGNLDYLVANFKEKYYTRDCSDVKSYLIQALEYGHWDIAKKSIEAGASNMKDALLVASRVGATSIVSMLIQKGKTTNGLKLESALYKAIQYDQIEVMKLLIAAGVNIVPALEWAVENQHIQFIRELVQLDFSDSYQRWFERGYNQLDLGLKWSAKRCDSTLVQLFIELGARNLNTTLLQIALDQKSNLNGRIECAKILLNSGATNHNEALMITLSQEIEILKIFADLEGANLSKALKRIWRYNRPENLKYLLSKVDSTFNFSYLWAPAIKSGNLEMISILIERVESEDNFKDFLIRGLKQPLDRTDYRIIDKILSYDLDINSQFIKSDIRKT